MNSSYLLTFGDVASFLADAADDEVIGITCHSGQGLLARVLAAKYPGLGAVSVLQGEAWVGASRVSCMEGILEVDRRFDTLHGPVWERAVTKQEWMPCWNHFFAARAAHTSRADQATHHKRGSAQQEHEERNP